MSSLEIALPATLLVLAFLLKLMIDRSSTAPLLIQSLIELPVDIAFLAMSFLIAYTINAGEKVSEGLLLFLIYIVCSILIVFFWRRSSAMFDDDKLVVTGVLTSINYAASISGIYIAINLVMGITTK